MKRIFQFMVVVTIVIHVIWARLPGINGSDFDWLAIGLWIIVGAGLLEFVPTARFVYLMVTLIFLAVIAASTDYSSVSDYWNYYEPGRWFYDEDASSPATNEIENVSLLLDGILLVMAYVTPIAYEFEAYLERRKPASRSLKFTIFSTDGSLLACLIAVALSVIVYMQHAVSVLHYESQTSTLITRAEKDLAEAKASNNKKQMAESYAFLGFFNQHGGNDEQAIAMYEQALALAEAGIDWSESSVVSNLARLYAYEPDDRFGDGNKALAMAQRAMHTELPEYVRHFIHNALANIHARRGQFDEALVSQERAIAACMIEIECPQLEIYYRRLQSYRDGKPWTGE